MRLTCWLGLLKTWGMSWYTLIHGNSMQRNCNHDCNGNMIYKHWILGWQTKLGPMVLRIQERVQRRYLTGDMSDFQQLQVPRLVFKWVLLMYQQLPVCFFLRPMSCLLMGPSWCVLGKETSTSVYWTGLASIFTSFSGVRRTASLMISHQPRCVAGVLHGGYGIRSSCQDLWKVFEMAVFPQSHLRHLLYISLPWSMST